MKTLKYLFIISLMIVIISVAIPEFFNSTDLQAQQCQMGCTNYWCSLTLCRTQGWEQVCCGEDFYTVVYGGYDDPNEICYPNPCLIYCMCYADTDDLVCDWGYYPWGDGCVGGDE
ncbi:MAG: hypothetical protein JW737_01145 [Acidobacteria bacterium]|nr:hypothetical protein [Acidobacteriota bacterium]